MQATATLRTHDKTSTQSSREVLALTQQYQSVRFGGAPFSEEDRRGFQDRVRALQRPPETAKAA